MNIQSSFLLFLFSILILACSEVQDQNAFEISKTDKEEMSISNNENGEIAKSVNHIAFSLYELQKYNTDFVFSPLSICNAFSMLYLGTMGSTKEEISETFNFDSNPQRQAKIYKNEKRAVRKSPLKINNKLWVQEGFKIKNSYEFNIMKWYKSKIQHIDFHKEKKSTETINGWVFQKTRKNIYKVLSERDLNSDTKLVLTNTGYFKGSWASKFKLEPIEDDFFNNYSSDKYKVKYICQNNNDFLYYENKILKMVNIPLKKHFSIDIILPKEAYKIKDIERELNLENYESWSKKLIITELSYLRLPKFKFSFSMVINDKLGFLGLKNSFTHKANFSKINKKLILGNAINSCTILINEKETQATESTIITKNKSTPSNSSTHNYFDANRPFIYILKNDVTHSIAFIGKVSTPRY